MVICRKNKVSGLRRKTRLCTGAIIAQYIQWRHKEHLHACLHGLYMYTCQWMIGSQSQAVLCMNFMASDYSISDIVVQCHCIIIILYSRLHIPILKSIISIVWESPHWRAHTLNHGHALANSLCEGTIHYKLHTIGVLSTRQVNCLLLNCLLHAHAWDIVHILLYWTRLDEGILDTEINSPSHLSCNLWPRAFPTLQCTGA